MSGFMVEDIYFVPRGLYHLHALNAIIDRKAIGFRNSLYHTFDLTQITNITGMGIPIFHQIESTKRE